MANNKEMVQLKERSFKVWTKIHITWQKEKCESVDPEYARAYEGCYAVNGKIIAFVDNGVLYLTPLEQESLNCLNKSGFIRKLFYVPFVGSLQEKCHWEHLADNYQFA